MKITSKPIQKGRAAKVKKSVAMARTKAAKATDKKLLPRGPAR